MYMTVFTPAYNRARTIGRLYESLKRQTDKDFEWLIVDDGSTDDTAKTVAGFIGCDNGFDIKYVRQENGGKHRAINNGVRHASGKLFFIVDSDDYLADNAVETIRKWESALPSGKWAGVAGLKAYIEKPDVVGTTFEKEYVDATSAERYKYNIGGDKAEAIYTDVIKAHPFPEYDGERFMTESVMWFSVAMDGYKFRWFNEVVYYCEYLEDGLTKNRDAIRLKNPLGYLLYYKISYQAIRSVREKLSAAYNYRSLAEAIGWDKKKIKRESGISGFVFFLAGCAKKIFGSGNG